MNDALEFTFSCLEFRQLYLKGFLMRLSLFFKKVPLVASVFILQTFLTDSLLACRTENLSLLVQVLLTHVVLLNLDCLFDWGVAEIILFRNLTSAGWAIRLS